MYKLAFFLITLNFVLYISTTSFANETTSEKVTARANDSVRAIKKGLNRTQEAVCMESDLKCAAKKAGNRVVEAKDALVDGSAAAKEKLD